MKTLARLFVLGAFTVPFATNLVAESWVERSNADAQVMFKALGKVAPEALSGYGLTEFDPYVSDLSPGQEERDIAAFAQARDALTTLLSRETDPAVKQDVQIMIDAAQRSIENTRVEARYLLPYVDVGRLIFQGEFTLLNPEAAADRHAAAVTRLRRYVGLEPGSKPATDLARQVFEAKAGNAQRLGPYRGEVEQQLANLDRYVDGIKKLFAENQLKADDALAALEKQLNAYRDWVRATVLPKARDDYRVPREVYMNDLRSVGLDVPPEELIAKAQLEFSEVIGEMQSLAPLIAQAHGWPESDYRDVIHHLKRDQLKPEAVEQFYRGTVIPKLEALIREHHVVSLPQREMTMRIASDAEAATQPAPHMQPPRLINNHGERGTFVLPLGNPPSQEGKNESYDDFTFPAGAWTLTAHEGRPGHELQFARMMESGVSYARAIFAFNSVNVEGWALYCESEMKPYEPLDAQLIVLQLRLLRAVRAFSDPMLNLGLMTRERAHEILVRDVCLSEAFAREEVDRFTFRWPGQAPSYFYGFSRLMQLRAATQIALGAKFDRMAFNDFLLSQGLLPPDLMAKAVREEFIPAMEKK